ncbi:MAG TPA: hypothetical protein GX734_02685 [Clostridiaceae bacterium]|nr:hypothetical protein [Clostridiaceae bacterium]
MRGRGWLKDIISHFVIVCLLGAALVVLYKKAMGTPDLKDKSWISTIFTVAAVLLALMVIIFIRQVFTRVRLERFRPGNPESLARLDRMRRFHLPERYQQLQETWYEARSDLCQFYIDKGWRPLKRKPFDVVLQRYRKLPSFGRAPYVDRLFIFYHPMLNVLIVDQTLNMCERAIRMSYKTAPAPKNMIVFLTDMDHAEEVTSAAAGIVNYLCRLDKKTSLYPLLIDFNGGKLYYPIDTTLVRKSHRLSFFKARVQLTRFVRKQIPKEMSLEEPMDTI